MACNVRSASKQDKIQNHTLESHQPHLPKRVRDISRENTRNEEVRQQKQSPQRPGQNQLLRIWLANPIKINRKLTLRSLFMTEFGHRKLSCDSSPSPSPHGPPNALMKQSRGRGEGDGGRPRHSTQHGDQQSRKDWNQMKHEGTKSV